MAASLNQSNSRVALITGGTKGIGFEVARLLAERGIEVLIGSRDDIKGETAAEKLAAENLPVTYVLLDVTKPATIDLAVTEIENSYGRLDILINNSSLNLKEPRPSELTLDMLRLHFEVNFFGAFNVTQAFLPLLRQSSAGRIVNISNDLGSFYFHQTNREPQFQCAFSASKAALNMLTLQLAKDLRGTRIKVNACAPGSIPTDSHSHHEHAIEIATKPIIHLATLSDDGPTGKFFGQHCEEERW